LEQRDAKGSRLVADRKIARINGIALDVVISETPDFQSEVTAYPVENGEDISDHVHNQPVLVTIEAVVSGIPIDLANERGDDPITQVRAALEELQASRQPFVYEGLRFTFRSMIFESLSFPVDLSTGDSLRISASMRRVNKVDVIRVSSRLRPAPKTAGHPIWLCPPKKEGLFLGIAGSREVKPGSSAALNRKAGCRLVVKRNGFYVFADNGKRLSKGEIEEMGRQNNVTVSSLGGHGTSTGSIGPGVPLASLASGGQPVAFAPGASAVKKMSQAKIPPPTPIGLPQLGDDRLSF
jgi:hypothetical protein